MRARLLHQTWLVMCAASLAVPGMTRAAAAQDSASSALFTKLHNEHRGKVHTPTALARTLGLPASRVKAAGTFTRSRRWRIVAPKGMTARLSFRRISGNAKGIVLYSDTVQDARMRVHLRRVPAYTGVIVACKLDMGISASVVASGKTTVLGRAPRHTNPRYQSIFLPVRNVQGRPQNMEIVIRRGHLAGGKSSASFDDSTTCKLFTYGLPRLIAPVARPGR